MKKVEFIERYGEEAYKRQLEQQKQYDKQHKEQKKQYREAHKEDKKQYNKQYKKQHREEIREYNRKKYWMFAFCIPNEIEQIENYELAKADNFNGWCIHHRLECVETGAVVNSSVQDLKDWGIYYNRPADELIFLTNSEHTKLHNRKKNREGL